MSPHFDAEAIDGVTVATLTGPKVAPEAAEPLYELAAHPRLVLDFGRVTFLSSNGIAIVLTLKRKVDAAGGAMRMCGLSPDLRDLFRLTKLDGILDIHDSRRDALASF